MNRLLLRLAVVVAALYALVCGAWLFVFQQPPEVWSVIVGQTPNWVKAVTPMRPIMMHARKGSLKIGDSAPDFELETKDHSAKVRLADYRGDRPVVLVFGSYT